MTDRNKYAFEVKFGVKDVSPKSRSIYEQIQPKKGEVKSTYDLKNDTGFEEPLPFVSAFPKAEKPAPAKGKKK